VGVGILNLLVGERGAALRDEGLVGRERVLLLEVLDDARVLGLDGDAPPGDVARIDLGLDQDALLVVDGNGLGQLSGVGHAPGVLGIRDEEADELGILAVVYVSGVLPVLVELGPNADFAVAG